MPHCSWLWEKDWKGGPNGILYAQPIADVLATAITALMAIPLHRRLNAA